jgi:FK506-binding nuclear protein
MAAIDPTAMPQIDPENTAVRSTLKLIREPADEDDDSDDEDFDDIEAIKARLSGVISDDEDEDMSDDDEDSADEKNGGPSDPAKTKQARKEALIKALQGALDEEMELDDAPNGVNGVKSKGKGKAVDDESSSDEEELDGEMEEFVICTLDPEKNYQQTLDIVVGEHERVYFSSNGTHDIYLTGNYVIPAEDHDHDHDSEDDYDSDEQDYDLSPDEDEILDDSDEDDELDNLANPRLIELGSDEDEAPKLVKGDKKAKNKRPAEDEDEGNTLDDLINKATKPEEAVNGEPKLSKKQAKKLKKNDGKPTAAPQEPAAKKDQKEVTNGEKKDKKVQFAKNLELGPTGSPKVDDKKDATKAPSGPRTVNGVIIDDKKVGKGPGAKKGDKIELRYIGKLKNGKQFDANKKGKPFSFKVGSGEVVKGMDIGVVGLTVGGERRITIPAKLAYGNKGVGDIPANSDLIFDIKCLGLH